MSRSLFVSIAAALCLTLAGSGQTKKSALDKATLEAYVRHLFVMDQRIKLDVADPKASTTLPGFKEVAVHASMGQQFQDFLFYVSNDGSRILQGSVYDVNTNPFKPDLDKLRTEFEPSIGTPGAPVVLVEFSDFQCPYCKQEAQMLRENLLKAYPKEVRLYFKTFPLESLHPWAKPAAIASRCVFQQQPAAFWEFHDWIFAHQTEIIPESLKDRVLDWAKSQKDLNAVQLGQCIDTKDGEAGVNKDLAEGQALGLTGTPSLFINGRVRGGKLYIGGTSSGSTLRALVEKLRGDFPDLKVDFSEGPEAGSSDHTSFTSKHVPALFFFSGLHSDYHKPSDTWDKIDAPDAAKVVDLVAEVAANLRESSEKPEFVKVAAPAGHGGGDAGPVTSSTGGYGPWFGSVPDFGEGITGVKFADVTAGSPAAKAGLKADDIMVEFDGKPIQNLYDFTYALRGKKPGDEVVVKVMRGGKPMEVKVTLGRRA